MSAIYLISILALLTLTILVKKSDNKLNIVKTITIIIVLFLCYQTFVSYLCTMLHIPITLLTLTIINLLLITILFINIIIKKEIQKYKLSITDLYFTVVLIFVVFIVGYIDFGIPFHIKYFSTDASIHYISAREFYESESLLLNVDNIDTSNAMMPGAYSNIGILFKIFAPWIGEMNLYEVFVQFDIFVLLLSGMLFYVTIKKYAKNAVTDFLAVIVPIIYVLGYPLNNMLFGYCYLGIGVLIINAIVAIMQDWSKMEETSGWKKIIVMFLLCFELFFSYYLFTPAIYASIFLYYLFYFHKQKGKWINKETVKYTIITLAIPAIIGFCYHVLPGMLSSNQIQVNKVMQNEGYIYRNLYSNILLFIPFAIYYLIKEKRLQFDIISVIIWILYMCALYLSIFKLNLSTYYFFKTYFVLWQFIIYLFFRGMCYIVQEKKNGGILTVTYVTIYVLLILSSFLMSNVEVTKDTFNKNEKITDVMDIYGINKTVLLRINIDYTTEELEILNYIREKNIPLKNNNTLIIANQRQEYWFWAMLQYRFKENLDYPTVPGHIELWNKGTYEYLIYFNRSDYYKTYKNAINLEGKEVIFENESGAIIKNK